MKLPSLITASLLCLAGATSHAQTFKCTGADGKVTYSNVACPDSTQSVRPVDTSGNTLDGSSLREKAQKDRADAAQTQAKEREQAAAEADQRQQAQARAADTAQRADHDAAAYASCTRDVDRQGVTEDVKAELYAACRTAGTNQRHSGMGEGAIRECVRSVERTGAYTPDRARQVATCHGADVKPAQPVMVVRPARGSVGPQRITNCTGNQCSDDAGQRYFKQQGNGLVREDGKACQLTTGNAIRCP